ncbi:hypothetical protein KIPB_012178, partial [Kipferlia bialata]|eukprot:g12178.t1
MSQDLKGVNYDTLLPADKEGWLYKEGGSRHNWKRRWFVLHSGSVFYFKSQRQGLSQGGFNLEGAKLRRCSGPKREYGLSVETHNPERVYELDCGSEVT